MSTKNLIIGTIFLLLVVAGGIIALRSRPTDKISQKPTPEAKFTESKMKIESSAFANNQPIPHKYTCDGVNISPPLKFSEVPENAQSLALIMDDLDAPGGTFVHWTVWNISPETREIAEGTVSPNSVQGQQDFGSNHYGGPCPPPSNVAAASDAAPSGTHRYFFKLYALDIKLDLGESARKENLEKAMVGHILAKAELIGLYKRE